MYVRVYVPVRVWFLNPLGNVGVLFIKFDLYILSPVLKILQQQILVALKNPEIHTKHWNSNACY